MKKHISRVFWAVLMIQFVLVSCHKDVSENNRLNSEDFSKKVNLWLDAKIGGAIDGGNLTVRTDGTKSSSGNVSKQMNSIEIANIDLLKNNLDFSSATKVKRDQDLNYLVIPIKDDLLTKKNLDKNSSLVLLLVANQNDEIQFGRIIYFTPADKKKRSHISDKTFVDIFYHNPHSEDGTFKYMSLTGRWQYQEEYKGGKLYSFGYIKSKNDASNKKNKC